LNDSLCPLSARDYASFNVTNIAFFDSSDWFASSMNSDAYNNDDVDRYLRWWKKTKDLYSEATHENGQLEIRLKVSEVVRRAIEEGDQCRTGQVG
jgi:hypothetical protein